MFVLGIDPGLSRCGYGLVRGGAGEPLKAVSAGFLTTPIELGLPERLAALWQDLRSLVEELHPDVAVVERVFFQTNAKTAMSVGQASGLALTAATVAGIPVVQYTSNEVKMALTGYGAATKAQVAAMVAALTGADAALKPPDITDALALAVCHHHSAGLLARIPRSASQAPPASPRVPTPVQTPTRPAMSARSMGVRAR